MKKFWLLLPAVLLMGCAENAPEPDPATEPAEAGEAGSGVAALETMPVSFVSGDVATLAVPEMNCQLACYPKVKRTLEGVEGVAAVELVEQQDEVQVDDRRVTITFEADVDGAAALAALESAGYPGSTFE
ncbi:MAG: hypothetical protein NXI04_27995 [Planctomycetaceae bacterium]|nr:hypothetical protein [Planctomycetaceae bacterium]